MSSESISGDGGSEKDRWMCINGTGVGGSKLDRWVCLSGAGVDVLRWNRCFGVGCGRLCI